MIAYRLCCGLIFLAASFAPLNAQKVGALNVAGDPNFDCDSISSPAASEHRWLSYPGGRLCLNPPSKDQYVIAPTSPDLALDVGGYVGTEVLRLPKVMSVGLEDATHPASDVLLAASQHTTWYPYKLGLEGAFADGAKLSGCDFFTDKSSTLIRVLEVKSAPGRKLCLTGQTESGATVRWDDKNQVLLVSGSNYNYALGFARLAGESWLPRTPMEKPAVEGTAWRLELPLDVGVTRDAISFGFSTASEGGAAAINRARDAFARPVKVSLATAKATFEDFLRKVPAPTQWGLRAAPALGVTPEEQRQYYYMAWTFLYQSLIDALPENPGYPYPQMCFGKAALWSGGDGTSPASCDWESFLGIQWLSFIEPDTAWQAYEGMMSHVDENGRPGHESLPGRKAQTAWILFQQKPDRKKLAAVYPAIKRYLLWSEQNPHWILGSSHDNPDEKDLEFEVSWLWDIQYAARIADALGKPDEAALWRSKTQPAIENMRRWSFSDPKEVHQYYFTATGAYTTADSNQVRPNMLLTALSIPTLPEDMVLRLKNLFGEVHHLGTANDGFNNLKYPDNDLVAYGLIQHGMPGARPYIEAVLRDSIRVGELAEGLVPGNDNTPQIIGVKPSLFTALNIIEFTWLLNGARYDSGKATLCEPSIIPKI